MTAARMDRDRGPALATQEHRSGKAPSCPLLPPGPALLPWALYQNRPGVPTTRHDKASSPEREPARTRRRTRRRVQMQVSGHTTPDAPPAALHGGCTCPRSSSCLAAPQESFSGREGWGSRSLPSHKAGPTSTSLLDPLLLLSNLKLLAAITFSSSIYMVSSIFPHLYIKFVARPFLYNAMHTRHSLLL